MRALEHDGLTPVIHGEHAYGIKAQKKKVHEVFTGKPLGNQMRMHETETAKAARSRTYMRKLGDEDGGGIPDDDHVHPALSVERETDLPRKQTGQSRQLSRLFGAVAPLRRVATLSQSVESLQLAGFQTGGVAFDPGGYCTPPAIHVAIMSS